MDKLEQIKETIEESAGLLDKQPEYNLHFDEFIRIISDYDRIKSVRLNHEDWKDTTYLNPSWDDSWLTESVSRPIWTNERIYTNIQATTSGSDAVVAAPRHPEEWCDFVTDDAIPF